MKKNFQFSIFNFQKRAFTLIETMVAVTILTLAIAGPLVTANRAIVAARISRDQLTASYLAQESIEYVRAMRDNNYLAVYNTPGESTAWTNFLDSIAQCNSTADPMRACTFDALASVSPLSQCFIGACPSLNLVSLFSDDRFAYTQQSGEATPFTRTIQIINVSGNEEKIVSNVSWSYHGMPYSVTIYDHLTPWQ